MTITFNMPFPPSPALSVCDSLADIDDLDAYLDSQPALSHFPTPPMNDKRSSITHFVECFDDAESIEYSRIAEILAKDAATSGIIESADVDALYSILRHAQLPLGTLAIASDILCRFTMDETAPDNSPSCVLTVTAALSLALSCTSDHAPNSAWWSKRACQGTWTTADIDRTALRIYAALDWNLHQCNTSAIDQAMLKLSPTLDVSAVIKANELPVLIRTVSVASSG